MLQEGGVKIWRPRQVGMYPHVESITLNFFLQIYVGAGKRDYVPIHERVAVDGLRMTPSAVVHSGYVQDQSSNTLNRW
jgi:citrate synthase